MRVGKAQRAHHFHCIVVDGWWARSCAYPAHLSTRNCHMLRDIKTARNALSEGSPMPARHRSALMSAIWFLTATIPATAQDIALPREPQIGPRPFYLVDRMKDGPLKREAQPVHRTVPQDRLFHRPPRRGSGIPRAHKEVLCGSRPDGRRHHRMRRDLYEGPRAGLPPFAVRPAHHDQHFDGAGACRQMLAGVQPR